MLQETRMGEPVFEVTEVIDERGEGDDLQYLVYWKPRAVWPAPTWQHYTCLIWCDDVLDAYVRAENDYVNRIYYSHVGLVLPDCSTGTFLTRIGPSARTAAIYNGILSSDVSLKRL